MGHSRKRKRLSAASPSCRPTRSRKPSNWLRNSCRLQAKASAKFVKSSKPVLAQTPWPPKRAEPRGHKGLGDPGVACSVIFLFACCLRCRDYCLRLIRKRALASAAIDCCHDIEVSIASQHRGIGEDR